jgi:hypothetical protein
LRRPSCFESEITQTKILRKEKQGEIYFLATLFFFIFSQAGARKMEVKFENGASSSPPSGLQGSGAKGKEKQASAMPALTIHSPAKQELQATKVKMEALARR